MNWYDIIDTINKYLFDIYFNVHIWYYQHIAKYVYFIKPKLIEPKLSEWIEISSLIHLIHNNYNYNTYELVNTNITTTTTKNIEAEYYSFYKTFYSNYVYSDHNDTNYYQNQNNITKEHVFISKNKDNHYLCRVCFPKHVKTIYIDNNESLNKIEEMSFLYIEYFHPTKMYKPIPLPFPNEMLQPLNELFTPAFVLRQLQTQTNYYYFDMDYILTILDQDLRTFELKSNQYIFIHKYNYEIIDRNI